MNTIARFEPELIAGAHIDYQVNFITIGNFPSELSSILLTNAFPLSPSPNSKVVEGLKVFTYQERYLCYSWFFQAGRQDERGRQTSSARVLIFPLENWIGSIPVLADVRQWLNEHDLENITLQEFYKALLSLADSTLSPALIEKAQQTVWFPRLLAESIQKLQVIIVASNPAEALQWLEILWYYLPNFCRFQTTWCTYVWSLRTEHEDIIPVEGQVEPPPSFFKRLLRARKQDETELRFDVEQGIASQNNNLQKLKRLQWLSQELILQQPWTNWTVEEKNRFIAEVLKFLSRNPQTSPFDLIAGYPASPKAEEFLNLFDKKN